jgi:hypothetical protein
VDRTSVTAPPRQVVDPPGPARLVPIVLGVQALLLALAAAGIFAGIGVGSTVLRIGVGGLLLVLAASAAGISFGYSDGQPAARPAAVIFEGFALLLAVLWFAPAVALSG